MKIDCISDLHGHYPNLEGGDLLIIAGDCTSNDIFDNWCEFFSWFKEQKYRKKILVAGNHDNYLKESFPLTKDFEYLCNSGIEFEGLKIWGTPHSLFFNGVNPRCKAFMTSEAKLEKIYAKIPNDIDILISHGPMMYVLDQNWMGVSCGSHSLRDVVDRIKPRLFLCGHIHERGSQQILYKHNGQDTLCVNCSYVNEKYEPINKPIRIEL